MVTLVVVIESHSHDQFVNYVWYDKLIMTVIQIQNTRLIHVINMVVKDTNYMGTYYTILSCYLISNSLKWTDITSWVVYSLLEWN